MGDADKITETGELRAIQDERAREADRRAEDAAAPAEAHAHRRRADKAAYLREKLAEAERAEAEAGTDDR